MTVMEMAMRRYHKKTRTGCDMCRQRRVKCDEELPACSRCMRRHDVCIYPQARLDLRYPSSGPASIPPSSFSPLPGFSSSLLTFPVSALDEQPLSDRSSSRLNEMMLIHRWSTVTYHCSAREHAEPIRDYVVQEALQCSYLMDSILALSSLDLATEEPDASKMRINLNRALRYQNRSISEMGIVLGNISEENCHHLLVASIVNWICAFLMPLFPVESNDQAGTVWDMFLRVKSLMVGTSLIMMEHADWIMTGKFYQIVSTKVAKKLTVNTDFSLENLRRLISTILGKGASENVVSPAIKNAAQNLENVFVDSNGQAVIVWLPGLTQEFIHELQRGSNVAIMLTMCWAALFYKIDNTWWTRYGGKRIVEELSKVVGPRSEGWNEITEWCRKEVGLDQ